MFIKLTDAMRKHALTLGAAADANDTALTQLIAEKFKDGTLTFEKLSELSADPPADPKTVLKSAIAEELKPITEGFKTLTEALTKALAPQQQSAAPAPATPAPPPVEQPKGLITIPNPDPREVLFSGVKTIELKDAHKQYSTTRKSALYPTFTSKGTPHPLANRQAAFCGVALDHPSDLDMAVNGAYLKWQLSHQIPGLRLTDHEKQLIAYALHEVAWTGTVGSGFDDGAASLESKAHYSVNRQKLDEKGRKDLLDDSASGGTNAVPVTFDDAIVMTPVLYGELFPLVEVKPWARGRLIDGSTMSNPTWTWNTAEGTPISPFSTTSFIAAMDTTIFPIVGAVLLGLDFEDDTPINFGGNLITKFGEKLQEALDYVVALGDGTTQPQGFFNATGIGVVTSVNSPNGPPTISDYETMMFGVSKAFRRDLGGDRAVYVANDTTYQRSRSIPTGPNDARRVFGMDHASYRLLDRPYKVQNDIPNTKAAYVNLAGYRMYRRLGMTTRIETGGKTLALANERLIVVRARFGGRLTLGGYACVNTGMQN